MARTTIRTGDITDSSVTAAKLASTAITDKLGYTPLQASDLNNYVTLTGTATLTNKTTQNLILTGTLTAGGGVGSSGQVLKSTGSGVQWADESGAGGVASNSFTTISVSGQSNVVADSTSDTLTVVAGTGISITTDNVNDSITIAANIPAAANSFSTITVAGQSNVVADSSSDTLTLSAGSGIAITTDVVTDTIALAIDSTVVTLTGTQTLTNKSLVFPIIAGYVVPNSNVTQTFTVTVVNSGYGNVFAVDGVNTPTLSFVRTGVYTFIQSDASNSGHQLAFKDGTGASYTTGVVTTGTPGSAGAQTVITVASNAPADLRYYCVAHGNGMGNTITVTGNGGSQVSGEIQINCQVNSHGQKIASQPHSEAATNKLLLPGGTTIGNADAVLVSDTGTQTLTNKTLTSPTINSATANNLTLTGTLTANAAVGAAGQVLKSTGTGVQWANESGGSSFSTITVAGQSNVVADSASDTLTLVAGSNVTLTTDATTDTITISATGGGGGSGGITTTVDKFTGNGSTTQYTLSSTPTNEDHTIVVIEGVVQFKDTYSVSGNVLTFSSAPYNGYNLEITTVSGVLVNAFSTIAVAGQSNVVADSSSDTLTLSAGSGIAITTTAGTDTIGVAVDNTVVTLTGSQTLTSKTLTSPVLGGITTSASGNVVFKPATNILEVQGDGVSVDGQIQLNCHVNSHGQKIASQPHSQAATNKLLLPGGTTIGNADAVLVSDTGTQTLSNKTISLSNNTVSGTLAQFNTAVTDADLATIAGSETLTNKTLTSPVLNTATADNLTLTGTLTANAAVGSAGQVLKSTGTGVQWANESGGSSFSTITVAGQSNVVADSASDTLTLVAGSNVTLTTDATTDTITISATGGGGGSSNSFATIAVSGQSSVVADSSTDTLTLVAGSGISITTDATTDTLTITNTGGGGGGVASDSFKTISVYGQSNVVADSATDTLTLTAGSGVSIVTDPLTDSITISATGGTTGGGTDIPVIVNSFVGNGTQTIFTLSTTPGNKDQTLVIVGGVPQAKATYSVSGTTLTFSEAPDLNYEIEIIIFAQSTTPGDGTSVGKAIALSMFFG